MPTNTTTKGIDAIKKYKIYTANGQDISRPVLGAWIEFKHTVGGLQPPCCFVLKNKNGAVKLHASYFIRVTGLVQLH